MTTTMASDGYKNQLTAAYLTALAFGYFDEDEWWDELHTDADLAMALELADIIDGRDGNLSVDEFHSMPLDHWLAQGAVVNWLRTEVRNALLERAQ